MENIESVITKFYPNIKFIRKDIGNRGYYIKYYHYNHECTFITLNRIINYIIGKDEMIYTVNSRKSWEIKFRREKLIALKIINEYENNFLLEKYS